VEELLAERGLLVDETASKISQQPAVALQFAQYESGPIAGEVATSKIYLHFSVP
jgi:hypothetical protein